jgi:hypothetical protein
MLSHTSVMGALVCQNVTNSTVGSLTEEKSCVFSFLWYAENKICQIPMDNVTIDAIIWWRRTVSYALCAWSVNASSFKFVLLQPIS